MLLLHWGQGFSCFLFEGPITPFSLPRNFLVFVYVGTSLQSWSIQEPLSLVNSDLRSVAAETGSEFQDQIHEATIMTFLVTCDLI